MTIANLGRLFGAALIAPINTAYGWEITVLSFSGLIVLLWITLQFLNINKQVAQIQKLDTIDLESEILKLSVNRN